MAVENFAGVSLFGNFPRLAASNVGLNVPFFGAGIQHPMPKREHATGLVYLILQTSAPGFSIPTSDGISLVY